MELRLGPREVMQQNKDEITQVNFTDENDIVNLINEMLKNAFQKNTSDIHIEPKEKMIHIKFRIDGQFFLYKNYPRDIYGYLKRRIKVTGGLKIDESRVPQDGKTAFKFGNETISLRISSFPTVQDEKIVIRILSNQNKDSSLETLGFSESHMEKIEKALQRKNGLVVATGPTGSGKSTTLFSLLKTYDSFVTNIATLEDPVEFQMKDVNQTQINTEIGFTFALGLRSLVRQDVDVIMVGEIRDKETMKLAIEASLTGHEVYSTIHSNSAVSTITRFLNIGIESFLLASSLKLIIAQRLVLKICPHCREKFVIKEKTLKKVEAEIGKLVDKPVSELEFFRPKGCDECNDSGYKGRIGVYEILAISPKIEELLLDGANESVISKQAEVEGMTTLRQDALLKASRGETSIDEAFKV
ncbi:type II/IV secretion system protein [Candidatus Gracilibacteria bacterium]|nr:type II/IV secretion system protein [Candidatus Gracilibacteria bacterium]